MRPNFKKYSETKDFSIGICKGNVVTEKLLKIQLETGYEYLFKAYKKHNLYIRSTIFPLKDLKRIIPFIGFSVNYKFKNFEKYFEDDIDFKHAIGVQVQF